MGIIDYLLKLLGLKSQEVEEPKMLSAPDDDTSVILQKKKDKRLEIISNSQDMIKAIHIIKNLSKDTKYHEKFEKVLELTQKIHDKIIGEEKVSINRLSDFHMYYSEEFINTFDDALNDLRPKKLIDIKLKSDFKLQNEIQEKKKVERFNSLIESIDRMTNRDKINIILSNINNNLKLLDDNIYADLASDGNGGIDYSYWDKFTKYLINNLNLPSSIKFVGELNDNKEIPIIFDERTLDVYKILNDKKPEKIGNISESNIQKILTDKWELENGNLENKTDKILI